MSLLRAGIEHILTGADHLAFLLALVLGGTLVAERRLRVGALVAMLTAFTVGHSASLAIATLGGFAPGSRLVEPAVALSVAYVGAENLFTRSVRHRWMLTLPFGFVHGFAFAGGLLPLGLPRAQLPLALLGFNLGVEAGQLLVLAARCCRCSSLLRYRAWYPRDRARCSASAIAARGARSGSCSASSDVVSGGARSGARAALAREPGRRQVPRQRRREEHVAQRVGLPRDGRVPEARAHEDGLGVRKVVPRELPLLHLVRDEDARAVELRAERRRSSPRSCRPR